MQSDYDKVAKKSKKRTEIGSASAIKAEIASAKKERKELEKNQVLFFIKFILSLPNSSLNL